MSYDNDDIDQYDDDDTEDTEQQPQAKNPLRAQIKRLERENKALKEKSDAGDKAVRDLEFVKAGVPVEDPKAKWFLKGYDGEVTADAIKAAAVEAGLIESVEEQQDAIPADERAANDRLASTSVGGGSTSAADAFTQAIADAKGAGDHQRVIELKQQQSAAARAQ